VALRDGAQGIAFALNADMVQSVLAQHLSAGKVSHVGHGLKVREQVPGGPVRQQVVVEGVAEKSPAAAAGLKPGDVLVRIGVHPLANRFDLERALWDCAEGEQVEAAVLRDGREARVALKLAAAAGERAAWAEADAPRGQPVQGARPAADPR
jgi:S1-C subfamily serine protease